MKILLIEDDPKQRTLFKYHFKAFHPEHEWFYFPDKDDPVDDGLLDVLDVGVIEIDKSPSATERHLLTSFNVVITDYWMPVKCTDIVARARRHGLPVVVMSASEPEEMSEIPWSKSVVHVLKSDVFIKPEVVDNVFWQLGLVR